MLIAVHPSAKRMGKENGYFPWPTIVYNLNLDIRVRV